MSADTIYAMKFFSAVFIVAILFPWLVRCLIVWLVRLEAEAQMLREGTHPRQQQIMRASRGSAGTRGVQENGNG
jgi:hypothetical protein